MSTTKITKATIKDGLFLAVEYSEDLLDGHGTKEWAGTLTIPVHKDLLNEFAKLDGHLAMICDELTVKGLEKEIEKYTNRGFSLKGEDSSAGVTLMGGKKTKHGYVNLNTPFQRFETSSYAGIGELAIQIEACINEVEQYLFKGKRAPEAQMKLFDGDLQDGQPAAAAADSQEGLDGLAAASKPAKDKGKNKLKAVPEKPAEPQGEKPPKKKAADKKKNEKTSPPAGGDDGF